jgi:hypothetical protein
MDVSGNDPTPPPQEPPAEEIVMFEDDDNDEMDEIEATEVDFDLSAAELVYEENPPYARGPGQA